MSTPPPIAAVPSALALAGERTDLANRRTLMAADRSLMAWVRTGLAMISFGFTIYKLLEGFQEQAGPVLHPNSPRNVGLWLTGLGTAAILMGTREYWQRRRGFLQHMQVRLFRPAFVMAVVMSLAGLVLFFGIVLRFL